MRLPTMQNTTRKRRKVQIKLCILVVFSNLQKNNLSSDFENQNVNMLYFLRRRTVKPVEKDN